uniref:Rad21_Rec8 domain-containing protein n=1 Tax=Panagrellus redivivus TaxID=6233 RepID=A0A7E4ULT1_PANRE
MSGLPNFFANFPDGRATHQGAAMFHVDEPQGDDSTTSVSSRLDCSRRGVGTPNRRGSQPTSVGLELDAVSEG